MPALSNTVLKIERSGIRVIMDLALELENVIRLEVGEPLFTTPIHIIEGTKKAVEGGFTKYTANSGILSLRESISNHVNIKLGLNTASQNILISVGAVGAIAGTLRAFVDAGDEVLIPNPGWPNYKMMVECMNAVPKLYKLHPENNFLPSFEELERAVSSKTKVLIINSPSNPLGVVFPEKTIMELVEFAKKHDLYIISDEVYNEIIFEGNHISAITHDTDGRVIGIFSFSKTYAMTGYRIGYAIADQSVVSQLAKLQEASVACASSISQKAAEIALLSPQDCVKEMVNVYKENMNIATKLLNKYSIPYQQPQGAFYIWIYIGCENSTEFAKKFLIKYRVSVAPGSTFGPIGDQYIRISLASSRTHIEEGIHRLAIMLRETNLK